MSKRNFIEAASESAAVTAELLRHLLEVFPIFALVLVGLGVGVDLYTMVTGGEAGFAGHVTSTVVLGAIGLIGWATCAMWCWLMETAADWWDAKLEGGKYDS